MNVVTRRMQCFACGKSYNVTPYLGGCWHITHAAPDALPFLVSSARPICPDPRCGSKVLADMDSERVSVSDGRMIFLDVCERPVLN